MSIRQPHLVLQHIRNLVHVESSGRLSDQQLLERFTTRQDEAAFEALVKRHGPLVFGVCRRVLHDRHEAEDAFQATFLILARRAATITKRMSLGGWLYQVAYRVALEARSRSASWRRRQEQARPNSPADPMAELSARELLDTLDEELHRLPERFRAPLVLYYLEERSREEAARDLGWSLGTFKRRLEEARESLRRRLSRRGLTFPLVLLTAGLSPSALRAAVPSTLAAAAVRAALPSATGGSAQAAATSDAVRLAETVLRGMTGVKSKAAGIALMAAASLIAVTVGSLLAGGADRERRSEPPATVAQLTPPAPAPAHARVSIPRLALPAPADHAQEKEAIVLAGRVVDSDGKAVPEARVAVAGVPTPALRHEYPDTWNEVLGQTTADKQGRFRLTAPASAKSLVLLARGGNHALAEQRVDLSKKAAELTLTLPPEHLYRGRLVNLEGQPVAGVQVWVANLIRMEGERPDYRTFFYDVPEALGCWPGPVTTDAHGRFTLRQLGPGYNVVIHIRDPRFARQEHRLQPSEKEPDAEKTFALAPARTLEGTVRYADTNKPVAGARLVVMAKGAFSPLGPSRKVAFQADEQGRFRVTPHAGNSFTLIAYPHTGEPYLLQHKTVEWKRPELVRQEVDFALPRGVLVRGTVMEQGTGKPVAGAAVMYEARYDDNPFYRNDVQTPLRTLGLLGVSGADGKFELAVLPGPGHLFIRGPDAAYVLAEKPTHELFGESIIHNYRHYADAFVSLQLKPQAGPHEVSISLRRAVMVKGRVVGPDGQPVQSCRMICPAYLAYGFTMNPVPVVEVQGGEFVVPSCPLGQSVPVYFIDAKNNLAARVTLSGKTPGEDVVVRLQVCGTAKLRVVDEKGQPVKGMEIGVEFVVTPGIQFSPAADGKEVIADAAAMRGVHREHYRDLRTDSDGRVVFPTLIPGAVYRIYGRPGGRYTALNHDFTVEAGQTVELPELKVKPGR
jgi:RNA polymerase sigma factor (sigma-70 family)